ncbi:MAG: transcriptional regulator, NifA subfamily, Fis Family, partial [Acidobacteriaceae bacterium]|nr:transcriptional regulator, NifA subfamily, Fis Family [Acidobacteriaceae bacterium]
MLSSGSKASTLGFSGASTFTSRPARTLVLRYGTAIASVAMALAIALGLHHYDLPYPFTSFSFAAIAITFWYAGMGPGLLALLLSCVIRTRIPLPVGIGSSFSESYLIIYGIFGLLVSWFSASRHRAERLIRDARDHLELRVTQRTGELTVANEELQSTHKELKYEKDRLKLLLQLTNDVVSNLEIQDVLKEVTESVGRIMRSDFAGVGLPDSESERLRIYCLTSISDGTFSESEQLPAEDSVPVRVFRTGELWVGKVPELTERQGEENSSFGTELKTACVLPLLSRNRSLGLLVLGRREDAAYSNDDIDFLVQLSKQIAIAVENALSYRQISELTEKLAQEKLYLEGEIRSDANFEEIIGKSTELRHVLKLVETVAPTDSTVLISGETGTGKELIARAIHNLSPRQSKTFVRLNCAALPMGLLESELFGHEKGAFTGAVAQRIGRLELANLGTLFLDEIGEIPLELQPKLLRVLQEREFERLGSTRTLRTDVRLIAATNRDLTAMVNAQKFRSDLFFRLNVFPIEVPPLCERPEDIPLLVRHFAEEFSRRMTKNIETISSETMNALCQYRWPGNIRELQNVIERAVILSTGPSLRVPVAELQPEMTSGQAADDV